MVSANWTSLILDWNTRCTHWTHANAMFSLRGARAEPLLHMFIFLRRCFRQVKKTRLDCWPLVSVIFVKIKVYTCFFARLSKCWGSLSERFTRFLFLHMTKILSSFSSTFVLNSHHQTHLTHTYWAIYMIISYFKNFPLLEILKSLNSSEFTLKRFWNHVKFTTLARVVNGISSLFNLIRRKYSRTPREWPAKDDL